MLGALGCTNPDVLIVEWIEYVGTDIFLQLIWMVRNVLNVGERVTYKFCPNVG